MKNYTRDYVNIDSLEKTTKKGFSLKKTVLVVGLSVGIGGAILAATNGNQKDEATPNIAIEQVSSSKVFKSYEIKKGDTLTSIVRQIMSEYPDTAKFYTEEKLIKEVIKTNNLPGNGNYITEGNYIVVPYYIPNVVLDEKKESYEEDMEASTNLDDYEQYVVQNGDSYWKIAAKYTNDNNEMARLIKKIQDLNGNQNLLAGTTITIPNTEKYQLQNDQYEESTMSR